eukprot:TRINITY_DN9200_c0_g1_i7.p1 TRINITY_DN9200_c0_g1~~TRINITY_DN9200_c0_g1_i7.p1  ORF type:complete len:136 (-),score=14.91 TRINITY_DN9200_c0_g1_i7:4-411(-)
MQISAGTRLIEIQSSFFFFKQKTAYEIMPSLVGSEMCIRDSLTLMKWWIMIANHHNCRMQVLCSIKFNCLNSHINVCFVLLLLGFRIKGSDLFLQRLFSILELLLHMLLALFNFRFDHLHRPRVEVLVHLSLIHI